MIQVHIFHLECISEPQFYALELEFENVQLKIFKIWTEIFQGMELVLPNTPLKYSSF